MKTFVALCCIALSPIGWASSPSGLPQHAPIYPYHAFDTLTIPFSSTNLNSVVVKSGNKLDTVIDLTGPSARFTAEKDSTGQIYVTVKGEEPFTLFVTTVQHHHVALWVTPQTIAGQTVILMHRTPPTKHKPPVRHPLNKRNLIQTRLHELRTEKLPKRFKSVSVKHHRIVHLPHGLQLAPVRAYTDGHALGMVYALQNTRNRSASVPLLAIENKQTLGVFVAHIKVPARGAVWCYVWRRV